MYDGKTLGQLVEGRAVGDPGPGVDLAVLDQPDDPREVLRQGVPRTEERPLGLVEDRMPELDLVRGDPDVNQPSAAVGDRPKACDIDALDPVASITTSGRWPSVRSRRSFSSVVGGLDRVLDAHRSCGRIRAADRSCRERSIFAPVSLTNSSVERPIGPAPMIRHDSSGLEPARFMAWQPIASVSTSAS